MDVEDTGIDAIDNAMPHLRPNGYTARPHFLSSLWYLLKEGSDALELSERRKEPTENAARLIREAASLLDDADSSPLATLLYSIAEYADEARYGRVTPDSIIQNGTVVPRAWIASWHAAQFTPGVSPHIPHDWEKLLTVPDGARRGPVLSAHVAPDAATAIYTGKRGAKANDANIVKALARYFPDSQEFFSRQEGYSIIARLAVLCGLENKNPKQYVRETLLRANKGNPKAEEPQPRRDTSITALFTGNKPA